MKPKLLIFGDSFADPTYNPTDEFLVYHYKLEKHFDIENFAKGGTGPEWSLQQFLSADKEILHSEKKDINILFLASDWARFNFAFYNVPNDQTFTLSRTHIKFKVYKTYSKFVDKFLKLYAFQNQTFTLHNMLLVKHYARHYHKCIYWPIFEDITKEVRETYNSKNFYMPDYKLDELEFKERLFKRNKPNHMNQESHDKVYQLIMDVFNETS